MGSAALADRMNIFRPLVEAEPCQKPRRTNSNTTMRNAALCVVAQKAKRLRAPRRLN